jgi:predicted DsbA family dithiol-disulfide isomerase
MTAPLSIDVVSDVVCPWCFIGKRRLEAAIASVPEIPVAVRWRPFQLDPTVPPGSLDREEYIRRKLSAIHASMRHMIGCRQWALYRFDLISAARTRSMPTASCAGQQRQP